MRKCQFTFWNYCCSWLSLQVFGCMFSSIRRSSVSSRERLCMRKQMFSISRVAEVRTLHLPLISFPLFFPFASICSSVPCGRHLRPSGGSEESGHLTKCSPLELDLWGKLAGPRIGVNIPIGRQRERTKRESRAINTRECNTSASDLRTDKRRGASVIAQLDKTFAFVIFTPHVCMRMCTYSVLWSVPGRRCANNTHHYNALWAEICKTRMKVQCVALMKENANCVVKPANISESACLWNSSCILMESTSE